MNVIYICPDNTNEKSSDRVCVCSYYFYKSENGLYTCLSENETCEKKGYMYKNNETKQCFNNLYDCINNEYKIFNNECYNSCPENTYEKNGHGICNCSYYYFYDSITDNYDCFAENQTCEEKGYTLKEHDSKECINYIEVSSDMKYLDSSDTFGRNICYYTCKNCSDEPLINITGIVINQNCLECIEGYHLIYETQNCYNDSILEQGYYLSLHDNQYHKCHTECKTCNNETSCILCNNKNGYYIAEFGEKYNCYNNESINEGYYLSIEETLIWKRCYERCKTCNSEGNDNNMNCLSCKSDLINNKTNKIFYFNLINGNCIETCEDNKLITPIGDCVTKCPNGTYEYSLNNSCLYKCPDNYEINNELNKCIFKTFSQNTKISEFKNQIMSNISAFANSSNVINGSDFLAVILPSDDMNPEEQLKKGISAVNLGNCTEVIKEYYNISKNEKLIILNIESKNQINDSNNNNDNSFNLGKNTQIEIYDLSGRKLNLSVCKEEIKIMKYIGDVEKLDILSAKNLASQGVDVFNPKDEFFNNICFQYNNSDGIDIILNDRRTDIYQNASFCQDGCTYSGTNYELMSVDCICDSSSLQEEKNNTNKNKKQNEEGDFKSLTKSFISNLIDFNFDVIKCSNLAFNSKILISNIGFYSLISMFFLQIIFLFIFLCKRLKPIRYFMISFSQNTKKQLILSTPPPKLKKYLNQIFNVHENDKDTSLNKIKKENQNKRFIKVKNKMKNLFKNNNLINDDFVDSNSNTKRKIKLNDINNNFLDINLEKELKNKKNDKINDKNQIFLKKNILEQNHKIKDKKGKFILMNNNINEIHVKNTIFNINDKNKKNSIDKKTNKKLFLNINKEVKAKSSKIKSKKLLNKKEEKNNYKDNIKQFHNNKGKSKELFINKL